MNVFAAVMLVISAAIAVLAGIGLLKFQTSYARFHAAGKASPIAVLAASIGAATEVGWAGAGRLALASAAMILTLPIGVHLLFRAVHRTTPGGHLHVDELEPATRRDEGEVAS